jgi:hypothetical protein
MNTIESAKYQLEIVREAHEEAEDRLRTAKDAAREAADALVAANAHLASNPDDNSAIKHRRAAALEYEDRHAVLDALAQAVQTAKGAVRDAERVLADAEREAAAVERERAIDEAAELVRQRGALEAQIATINAQLGVILEKHANGDAVTLSNVIRRRAGVAEIDQLGRPFVRAA